MSVLLVVDDEPAILEVVAEFARVLGHDVLTAIDGEDALAVLRNRRPDLIITDLMMPRLGGAGLCEAVQRDPSLTGVPIIVMSAVHKPSVPRGATIFIKKPFELDELEATIGRVLPRGTIPSRAIDLAREARDELTELRSTLARLRDEMRDAQAAESILAALTSIDEVERHLTEAGHHAAVAANAAADPDPA